MAALAPPQNGAGVVRPPVPGNPASLVDITDAKEYVDRLTSSKTAHQPNAATAADIGAAEAYKTAVIFSHSPGGNAAPPWLADLTALVQRVSADVQRVSADVQRVSADVQRVSADVQRVSVGLREVSADVTFLRRQSEEMPVILANNQAGNTGPLLNPTAMNDDGWAPLLVAPNPRTRDELRDFTLQQCAASAASLGLPAPAPGTSVASRRRQIAIRIGVTI